MNLVKSLTLLLTAIAITACGGISTGGSTSSSGAASISIDKESVTFTVDQNEYSDPQLVNATFKGDFITVEFAPDVVQPNWLEVELISSKTTTAVVRLAVNSKAPIGTSRTSIRFVTGKSDGSQLKTVVVLPINVTVNPVIKITSAPYSGSFIYGSSSNSENYQVNIDGSNSPWTATSDQPWLQVVTSTGTGNAALQTKVNIGNLSSGTYIGHLKVSVTDIPNKFAVLAYTVNISNPTLSVIQSSILLGGVNGLSTAAQDVSFSINTGSTSHPYTISLTTEDGRSWLKATNDTGTTSAATQTIKLYADTAGLSAGTYNARAIIQTTVGDVALSKEIPVQLNKEANRIVASATGVAFSSLPNRSLLTRDIKVFSTRDRTDVPWTATSDQAWLTATASGVTGDSVRLTATAGSLATGHVYFATVTIKSTDSSVENQETIRVGFTVSDTAATDISIYTSSTDSSAGFATVLPFLVASPVEPLVFTNVNGNTIKAFNVYTGAEERSFSGVVAKSGGMAMSDDGLRLYIYDNTNFEVVEVDSITGTLIHKYSVPSSEVAVYGDEFYLTMAYTRPDGHPILVGVGSHIYDISTHTDITQENHYFAVSEGFTPAADPRLVVDARGQLFKITRSALNGGSLHSQLIFFASRSLGASGQACLNAQGTRVYTFNGYSYNFLGTNVVTDQLEQELPGHRDPNSLICGWNGLIIGGTDSFYDAEDIFIYNGFTGQSLGNKSSSTNTSHRSLIPRGLALSGDATRLISISKNYASQNQIRLHSVPGIP
jgi:Viral BACON domain